MVCFRWRTIGALFTMAILGASVTLQVPTLAAKDKASGSASTADKAAKKKRSEKRPSTHSADPAPSADDVSSGGSSAISVGGGGGIAGGGSGTQPGSTKQSSGSVPTGNVRQEPVAKAKTPASSRKGATGRSALNSSRAPLNATHPLVKKVIDVQNRNHSSLSSQKGIVGTATGLDGDGNVVIRVYTTGADSPQIPDQIEGVAVLPVLTGPVRFAQGIGSSQLRPPTPAPIGVSTFVNTQGQIAVACQGNVGTVGCRMIDNNRNIYALSCNHVFAGNQLIVASFNQATQVSTDQTVAFFPAGTQILQPAGSDVGCVTPVNKLSNILGTLFVANPFYSTYTDPQTGLPVLTSANKPNLCDCALASTSASALDTATPTDGYGIPTDNYVPATLGMAVQKYGAATRLTTGTVAALNATYSIQVDISTQNVLIKQSFTTSVVNGTVVTTYVAGFAGNVNVTFTQQVEVIPAGSSGAFAQSGDSGALVVDASKNPTALVQALGLSPNVFCGDFNNVKTTLVQAIALATGAQVALHVDTGASSLQQSLDGKVGRGTPNTQ